MNQDNLKGVHILPNKVLVKRQESKTESGILLQTGDVKYLKGTPVLWGDEIGEKIAIFKNGTVMYDKFPEIIDINGETYDLISLQQIKYSKA